MKKEVPVQSQKPDYSTLRKQLNDYESTFYGPHCCEGCGRYDVVRKAFEQGADSWEGNEGEPYSPHRCSHVLVFRKLAGQVLTVIDAAFPPASPQLKAIKNLLKRDISAAIARTRELEGDRSAETCASIEQLATG
jgi:hypothetical protein